MKYTVNNVINIIRENDSNELKGYWISESGKAIHKNEMLALVDVLNILSANFHNWLFGRFHDPSDTYEGTIIGIQHAMSLYHNCFHNVALAIITLSELGFVQLDRVLFTGANPYEVMNELLGAKVTMWMLFVEENVNP